jgi:hypothetical protein
MVMEITHVDPKHVTVDEQLPSVLTDWGGAAIALPDLYQFAAGSPRQSPTVTDLYPCLYIEARI